MSLWYQSLSDCWEEELGENVRNIFAHLAMSVPRAWWQHALQNGIVPPDSYISILRDLRNTVLDMPGMSERVSFSVLVALAFIDDTLAKEESKYGSVCSRYSIEEYLVRANKILIERPELAGLGEEIEKREELLRER